jgi:hypothetical protein
MYGPKVSPAGHRFKFEKEADDGMVLTVANHKELEMDLR